MSLQTPTWTRHFINYINLWTHRLPHHRLQEQNQVKQCGHPSARGASADQRAAQWHHSSGLTLKTTRQGKKVKTSPRMIQKIRIHFLLRNSQAGWSFPDVSVGGRRLSGVRCSTSPLCVTRAGDWSKHGALLQEHADGAERAAAAEAHTSASGMDVDSSLRTHCTGFTHKPYSYRPN